jgi:signal transduction histidine kinase
VVTTADRKPWRAIFRLLERDERVFAVLLAVAMVGGLATAGLIPLRPRYQIDLYSLVIWFALYKLGVFALVTVHPRSTRAIFLGALAIDLTLVFVLVFLTGGGDSLFYLLFFPLVAVNAYYFGPWIALAAALIAGGLMAAAATLAPPWIGWSGVTLLTVFFGVPAIVVGIVAERERGARGEVERLNVDLAGTLSRLQATQRELLVAERMATVGRLSLKVAHEVRNPIAAIELNAELLQDIVRAHPGGDMDEATGLVAAIRDQVTALDALTEEYLVFARFPKPHFETESINHLLE